MTKQKQPNSNHLLLIPNSSQPGVCVCVLYIQTSSVAVVVKNPAANIRDIGDMGLISGLGRSLGGGHGHPLQFSCLGNSMDRRAWRATVRRVAKSWTQMKQLGMCTHICMCVHGHVCKLGLENIEDNKDLSITLIQKQKHLANKNVSTHLQALKCSEFEWSLFLLIFLIPFFHQLTVENYSIQYHIPNAAFYYSFFHPRSVLTWVPVRLFLSHNQFEE